MDTIKQECATRALMFLFPLAWHERKPTKGAKLDVCPSRKDCVVGNHDGEKTASRHALLYLEPA